MFLERLKHFRPLTVVCLACAVFVALLYLAAESLYVNLGLPFRKYELTLQDWVARLAKPVRVDDRLVYLSIDEASHTLDTLWEDELAASPVLPLMKKRDWSRDVYAHVLNRLADAGARVVAFDLMFPSETEEDSAFRDALNQHRDVAIIGCQFEDALLSGTKGIAALVGPTPTLIPLDERVGFVNFWADEDGIIRRALFQTTREELFGTPPSPDSPVYESLTARVIRQAGFANLIPQDRSQKLFRFAFHGELLGGQNNQLSLYGIFVPAIWEANYGNGAYFKNKIVLIGPGGRYNKDVAPSPFGTIAGPEFHLSAINAVLGGYFLRESPLWADLLLIAAGALCAWLNVRLIYHPNLRLILAALGTAAWVGCAVSLYHAAWVVPVLDPPLALLSSTFAFSIWEQVRDRRDRKKMRSTLERYVGHDVVRELLDNPETYLNALGGVRKTITILFSDVRGFTARTERADAHALVSQLNEYFEEMVAIVFSHHGTLDKFIGDAVMAHWGSMVSEGEATDAIRAVTTVLKMREALARLNKDWQNRGMETMRVGYGVNHGDAIVGNLGCGTRMDVTVIGDAVNLGSRLEGATKTYKIDICLGGSAAELVRDSFILRSVDLIIVQGKTEPVEIFTVLGARNEAEPAWLARHEQAMKLYRAGEFAHAATVWRDVLADVPGDGLSRVLLDRCLALHKNPPTEEWTGVYEMQTK